MYLSLWIERSGRADVLPSLTAVYVDQTALAVTGGVVEVVSEGSWRLFAPPAEC